MTTDPTYDVLFLCYSNSARSILAEAILEKVGGGRFRAHSAGSHPAAEVDPYTIDLLRTLGHPTERLRTKPWDEFAGEGAAGMDFVFTVCDDVAGELCDRSAHFLSGGGPGSSRRRIQQSDHLELDADLP